MGEVFQDIWNWVTNLGESHNVNPIIFGTLYLISIPPYLGSMGWAVQRLRKKEPVFIPIISTMFFFIMPALYVLIFGRNVAWYIYVIIGIMIVYGTFNSFRKFRFKIETDTDKKA